LQREAALRRMGRAAKLALIDDPGTDAS
jgi:hypothetical protein